MTLMFVDVKKPHVNAKCEEKWVELPGGFAHFGRYAKLQRLTNSRVPASTHWAYLTMARHHFVLGSRLKGRASRHCVENSAQSSCSHACNTSSVSAATSNRSPSSTVT